MEKTEITRLQTYLRQRLGNQNIAIAARKEAKDSAEFTINGEFAGVIYRDEDEGEVSYDLNMAILEMDLPPA
jgi:Protein of unknown function (DUF3126)